MIFSTPSARRVPIALLVAASACWSAAAAAQSTPVAPTTQPAPTPADTVSLTDEQRLAILDGNTLESAAAARGELPAAERAALGIHGEVGVMVGSNGSHAVYGTAAIPLSDNATAVVSFESSRYRYRR